MAKANAILEQAKKEKGENTKEEGELDKMYGMYKSISNKVPKDKDLKKELEGEGITVA